MEIKLRPSSNNKFDFRWSDSTNWSLIVSNLLVLFFAYQGEWTLTTLIWVYWVQTSIIGIVNLIRIVQLKEFTTDGFLINDQAVLPTPQTKRRTALFFLIHFGGFQLFYALFLLAPGEAENQAQTLLKNGSVDVPYVALSSVIFLVNHLYSYFKHRSNPGNVPNIGSLMFYPYLRIFPMHVIIILGYVQGFSLPFFILLKTMADVLMHSTEHSMLRGDIDNRLESNQSQTENIDKVNQLK